jgi:glycosyltransferase involved in cell wall biosynthesis
MRIVLIGPAFDIAGASLNLLRIADILQGAGHTLTVAAMERRDGVLRQAYLDRGIPVVEGIAVGKYDLAICNTILTGDVVSRLGGNLPAIWWIRECLIGSHLVNKHPELAAGFASASRIIFQSRYIRDQVFAEQLKDVPDERVRIVPQGIPVPESFPRPERRQHHLVVMVGTLTARKMPRQIFRAIASLERDDVELVSVGKLHDVDPEVPRMVENDPEHFRMLGELPREACYGWIAHADLLAHAASDESQPNVLIEAAFAGTPIAASNLPVLQECGWVDGENCLLHEVGDQQGLAHNIARLIDDPVLGQRLAQRARDTVCPRFDMATFTQRLLGLVEETVAA